MPDTKRIAVLGAGNIGGALIGGILTGGVADRKHLVATERSPEMALATVTGFWLLMGSLSSEDRCGIVPGRLRVQTPVRDWCRICC